MKISIVTATYNSALFVSYCLDSVKLQKYENIEHIIIDGASTDKTLSLLNARRDQIQVLVSEKDKGIYDAMNKGINLAKGDIIGFLNSDDIYANNNILSKVASLFNNNPTLEACYADLVYTNKFDTSKNIRYWKSNQFIPGSFSKGWCPPHPTFFVRRTVYERLGIFNLNYSISADVELMMRFIEVNKINICYVPEVWVKMRMGGLSNSNLKNIFKQNLEVLHALNNHDRPKNFFTFFIYKFFSRLKQFFQTSER
jgi:glycosyltransferase involved in cell wall biosynthesis